MPLPVLPQQQQPSPGRLAPALAPFPLLGFSLLLLLPHAWAWPVQSGGSGGGDSQEVVPVWTASPGDGGEGRVSFSVAAFGEVFALRLVPDASFLAPGLKIQRVGRKEPAGTLDGEEEEEDAGTVRRCFYSGTVNSQPDSLVALSLCQGIRGSFLVDGDKYMLQPRGNHSGGGEPLLQVHRLQKQGWASPGAEGAPRPGKAPGEPGGSAGSSGGGGSRPKRFTSEARYVETLLVADASMVRFYGDELKVSEGLFFPFVLLQGSGQQGLAASSEVWDA